MVKEEMNIDVVLLTKNSLDHSPVFGRCLNTLYREVPVNRLIVVDGFSEDGTIEVLEDYPRVEIHQIQGNRAVARQCGLEQVKTEWFLFIDDDVILCNDWFSNASKYMTKDVGLIWGWDKNPLSNSWKAMAYLRNTDQYGLRKRMFTNRGGTHDTLVRKKAIKGIKIPEELHIFEDKYIKESVQQNGYKCIVPREVFCYHYFIPNPSPEEGILLAKLQRKTGAKSRRTVLFHFILSIPKSLTIFLVTQSIKETVLSLKKYFYNFYGMLYLSYKEITK